MCLILLAYQTHPRYRLILAANRDEFHARPTLPLGFWTDHPEVLAGRDLQQGGTWLGVTRAGRLAAITNFRDPRSIKPHAPSRGHLVSDFLSDAIAPEVYLQRIAAKAEQYSGFNLVVGDRDGLFYFSNFSNGVQQLKPGLHGLSNHLLDTPWPKVEQSKQQLAALLHDGREPDDEALFALLQNQTIAPDDRLPSTGVDLEWERLLSPIFITSPAYGTRSSSVLTIDMAGRVAFAERTWQPGIYPPMCMDARGFHLDTLGVPGPH